MFLFVSAPLSSAAEAGDCSAQRLEMADVLRATLAAQPGISLAREQLAQGEALLNLALAEFDWMVEAGVEHRSDYRPTDEGLLFRSIRTTTLDLRFVRKTRCGVLLEPGFAFAAEEAPTSSPTRIPSVYDNALRVFFNLNVPLLQGFGVEASTSREEAARQEREAARHELLHAIAVAVRDTATAYWDYTAAYERQENDAAAEGRAAAILANTEALVHADELPQAELVSARSNLLEKKIAREHAELDLLEARRKLGQVSGIDAVETAALPLPRDPLPVLTSEAAARAAAHRQEYLASAARSRNDLLAADRRVHSAELLLLSVRDAARPRLDLVSGIGYDGYRTGSGLRRALQAAEFRQNSPDWSLGLRFSTPIENRAGRGNEALAGSRLAEARIRRLDLQRTVETSTRTALDGMQTVARESARAEEAVSSYQKAVENEREKYLMGEATLFDLLFMQDKLHAAQLSRIDAHHRGALLLTRLQYESATMLECRGTACRLSLDAASMLVEPKVRSCP